MREKMDNLVSIIVPVYNASDYIEETIKMVCCQTFGKWELLLIDDCSNDDSRAKISEYCKRDGRLRLIVKEKNEGAALARNTGIDHAKGRYIAFLDADDIWMPEKLEKELEFMERKKAAFAFTAYEFGDENACGTGKIVRVPEQLTYKEALSRTIIFTTTVMFDLKRIDKNMIKMPNVASEDTAAWWRILRNGYTACGLDDVLAIYRRPGKSLSSNKFVAVRRIWNLYRKEEKLSLLRSACYFTGWAFRAVVRRI